MDRTIRVEAVRQVFNDGNHNAFTDLCRFRGHIYLTFRSCPDGHMIFTTSRIVVLRSADGEAWERVHDFNAPDRDVRDPHFLVFRDRLFVYTGTWLCEEHRDINHHLGYTSWTEDGATWRGPRFLEGTYGHYVWRAAAYRDRAYLCGRRKREFARTRDHGDGTRITESVMLGSTDGFVFWPVGSFQTEYGDETAFLFEENGSVLALARDGAGKRALICRSKPPYAKWTRTPLDRQVGGPLLAKWGDQHVVGGRKTLEGQPAKTSLYLLVNDRLVEIAELPSGGDTSYPGFVPISETEGLVSYYSSHEGSGTSLAPSSIYCATLKRT